MVKSLLILLFVSQLAHADLFDFGSDKEILKSELPDLIKKLKTLNMKDDPEYEESFNKSVRDIENALEHEKLFCSGEATDSEGKTLPPAQKQLCMRELKKDYLEASMAILELKKKYLAFIHQRQLEKLNEVQKKLKADIEKNF